MDYLKPVFTKSAECQDCYKCLRQCPVKAIRIQDGHAAIMPDMCIMCGHCVEVCPVGAKVVRDDFSRVQRLLEMTEQVYVSLAPSYVAEFRGLEAGQVIAAFKALGFAGVSETALGAQEVSANLGQMLFDDTGAGIHISSACPTVVEMIKKYEPAHADRVTNMLSPVLAHCKLLRREFGESVAVVFVGPCIAKKAEADTHPDLLSAALTFEELGRWWREAGIDPQHMRAGLDDRFVPATAEEGALYPVDGGMIAGVKANCPVSDAQFMSFSGTLNIQRVLDELDDLNPESPLFIEMLACEGGCVNGPCGCSRQGTALKRYEVIHRAPTPTGPVPRAPRVDIAEPWPIAAVRQVDHSEDAIHDALRTVGKHCRQDELNCGGCGYDSCRQFARALLDGRAERNMCVGYMRQLAAKKADALIRTMPAGVVIVDQHLRIVECNRRFAEMLGEEAVLVFDAAPEMAGASLRKLAPFYTLFEQVLTSGTATLKKDIKLESGILSAIIFTIEEHHLVGGVIQDITAPAVQKQRIIENAQQVITRNLATVQQIAYLLGENAAESEVILNSIIESFTPEAMERGEDDAS